MHMLSTRDPLQLERHARTESKERKIFHVNEMERARVAISILGYLKFKTKAILRDKEGHYIMIRGTIQQE